MAEEFAELLDTMNKKDIILKIQSLGITVEKSINYFNYCIEALNTQLRSIAARLSRLENKTQNPPPPPPTVLEKTQQQSDRNIGNEDTRNALMGELKSLFKKRDGL